MKKRIVELSYKNKLSHVGSCLSVVDIIDAVYSIKLPDEKFILSGGHAHLAHMVVMEKYGKKIGKIHDIHCNFKDGCDVPTGSLGQGLPIAVGMALAHKHEKNVYCEITDGEFAEGSIYEALRIAADEGLTNLKLIVNANGFAAYKQTNVDQIVNMLRVLGWGVQPVADGHNVPDLIEALKINVEGAPVAVVAATRVDHWPFLKGLDAHYHTITKEEYEQTTR